MDGLALKKELLKNTTVFRSLPDDILQKIIDAPENCVEQYQPKDIIIRESEIGDCMYIILEGVVEVLIRAESSNREIAIATLRAGDFFGERSLLPGSTGRRNASVKTLYPTKSKTPITSTKPPSQTPLPANPVRDLIMKIPLFRSLNRAELLSINQWTDVIHVAPGNFVVKEAQPADAMYVVLSGTIEIFTLDPEGNAVILAKLKKGDYFGEQALMPDSKGKRNAFARTNEKSSLIKIPKEYFRLLLKRDSTLAKLLKAKGTQQKIKLKNIRQR
jgi:cAMP-dependent protein kinase regulator